MLLERIMRADFRQCTATDPLQLKWSALRYGFRACRTDEVAKHPVPEEIVAKPRLADVLISRGSQHVWYGLRLIEPEPVPGPNARLGHP